MLLYTENITSGNLTSAYSFGLYAGFRHKKALYSQILANAKLKSGDVVLELSCPEESCSRVIAAVKVAETGPMGGLPGMLEITSYETCFGKDDPGMVDLPWSGGSFDTILCIGIFNHLSDHEKSITQLRQLLSPKGKLIIADQWFRKATPMFASLLQPYNRSSNFRIYSPTAVNRLLRKSGFAGIETWSAGTTNFLCTATLSVNS